MKIALLRMQLNWLVHVFLLCTYIFYWLNWNWIFFWIELNLIYFRNFPIDRNDDSHWTQMMYKYYGCKYAGAKGKFVFAVCLPVINFHWSVDLSIIPSPFHPSSCWLLQINTYWAISETNSDAMNIPNFMAAFSLFRSSALSISRYLNAVKCV